ncbi:twin-arginine translocase subunit TatC [Clostridium arbusti]|uniref:twin-arginine translocase subunit TatC n=1 Tax=Clostridium arbusti TaxID=1137848 RepID=UPI0002891081|nr:twin-arginine translocase subunit TatC [Clostridium arbusti]
MIKKKHNLQKHIHIYKDKLNSNELGTPKTILNHLKDLRKMLLIISISIGIAFNVILIFFVTYIMDFITKPLKSMHIEIIYTGLSESFSSQVKVSLIASVIVVSPIIFWQIWSFLKPALYQKEQLIFGSLFILGIFLFILGVVFAYIVVLHLSINFFVYTSGTSATPMISISKYVDFLFSFLLPFGIMFEIPIAIIILTRLGIITINQLTKSRKYVIFAIFIIAAILTPPDVISQISMAIPLIILYEISILACKLVKKRA